MSNIFRVCLAQLGAEDYAEDILSKIEDSIERAQKSGASLLITPETILNPGGRDKIRRQGPAMDGNSMLDIIAQKAKACHVHVVLGQAAVINGEKKNCASLIDCSGNIVETYEKTHLWDDERKVRIPGGGFCNTYLGDIPVGIMICYDIEFPEVARSLALGGAQILIVPSANMHPYGHAHRTFAMARAIENHVFVLYCNMTGPVGQVVTLGESCVVDPFGGVIAELGNDEGLLFADCDLDKIAESKSSFDYIKERRPELYHQLVERK